MKSLIPLIFLSIFIHALFTVLFMKIKVSEPPVDFIYFISENEELELFLESERKRETESLAKVKIEPKVKIEHKEDIPSDVIEVKSPDTLLTITETVKDSLQPLTHYNIFFRDTVFLSKPEYNKIVKPPTQQNDNFYMPDSYLVFKKPPGSMQNWDNVADRIYQKSRGYPKPTVSVPRLLQSGANFLKDILVNSEDDKSVRMDFLPNEKQLEALNIIWQNQRATDQSIYASFDTSIKITATDLNIILEKLAARGLLKRKIVSPRNEFTFFGLTGEGGIEMSPTNRRNRIYEYQPLISKDEMVDYLNAVFYQVKSEQNEKVVSGADSLRNLNNIQKLLSRIY